MTRYPNARDASFLTASLLTLLLTFSACSDDTSVNAGDPAPPDGPGCFDYSSHLHTVTLVPTTGVVTSVDAAGDLLCLVKGDDGIQLVDAGHPSGPRFLGGAADARPALDAVFADSIVCVAVGANGMAVVDVGDPDRPIVVGRAGTPGAARGIWVSDAVAYLADDVIGLMIFDVRAPESPVLLGVDNTSGRAVDVAVSGVMAYVADEIVGLRVVNVADPSSPWLVNTVPALGAGRAVAVEGHVAYVATAARVLQILDISLPGGETIVGSLTTRAATEAVAVDGRTVFVAEGRGGMEVVDVTDPSAPMVVNTLSTSRQTFGVAVDGNHAYLAENTGGFRVVSVDPPIPPPVVAAMPVAERELVEHVAVDSGVVFAVGRGVGFFSVERNHSVLTPSASVPIGDDPQGLAVGGGFAYVATGIGGIEIIDVGDPSSPNAVGRVPFAGTVVSVDITGDRLYFVGGGQVFGVYQISSGVVTTTQISTTEMAAVEAAGNYAYVAEENSRLVIVDVAGPNPPWSSSAWTIEGKGEGVLARDDKLYVLTSRYSVPGSKNGVAVYSLPVPTIPQLESFVYTMGTPRDAAIAGDILYVVIDAAGLAVFDVSEPANPVRIGSWPSGHKATGVVVNDGGVFVADGAAGLVVVAEQSCFPVP